MQFGPGLNCHQLEVGMKESFGKTIIETDVHLFAGISRDFTAMQMNEECARLTPFSGGTARGDRQLQPKSLRKLGQRAEYDCGFHGPTSGGKSLLQVKL